jgi:hypothetical protein
VPRLRSGLLAAWNSAWLVGRVGPDEVVDACTGADAPHLVDGLGLDVLPLRELLVTWRRTGSPVRAVLPVPGDVRGLPGPPEFRAAAIEAGEAVCGVGLAAVPHVVDHAPSSAPTTVRWQTFATEGLPPDPLQLNEAQYDLTTAIRESATALAAADVAAGGRDVGEALAKARRAGERLDLPPGFPPSAVALLAQAERLQAVLELAGQDPVGGAIDRTGMLTRAESLRPLGSAVRRARMAAYNGGTPVG